MINVWGMLSCDEEQAGFSLALDENWYVLLVNRGNAIASFDPRDYTAAELRREIEMILKKTGGKPRKRRSAVGK